MYFKNLIGKTEENFKHGDCFNDDDEDFSYKILCDSSNMQEDGFEQDVRVKLEFHSVKNCNG